MVISVVGWSLTGCGVEIDKICRRFGVVMSKGNDIFLRGLSIQFSGLKPGQERTAISFRPRWAARCKEVLLLSWGSGFWRYAGFFFRIRLTNARSFCTIALRSLAGMSTLIC